MAAFVRTARDRWQEIVDALKAPIAVLFFAAEGDAQALRDLEPAGASVDQLLGKIAQETGVRVPPELFARAAREASPLIPHLLGVLMLTGLLLVWAFVETIKEEYGEDFKWFLFGPPQEAAAYRALFEDADVRHLLRVFGNAGELGLAEHLAGYEFPIEELEAEVRATDWMDKTFPELHDWRETTVRAAYTVAEYRACETGDDARAQAVAALSPGELLQFARVDANPRGFAAGNEVTYRRLENARKWARRHVKHLQRDAQG